MTTTPNKPPTWLPALIPFHGEWASFVQALYAVFSLDFKNSRLRFRGCPIWYDRRVLSDDPYGYEEGFWHLVTRDMWVYDRVRRCNDKQRLPEIARAQHLPWGKPIVVNEHDPQVVVWDFDDVTPRGKKVIRTYLWVREFDFAVILEKQTMPRGDTIYMLITTFFVDVVSKRLDLESRYERRKK